MKGLPDRFYGKTWIFTAQAWIFGAFTLFGLILGPLFLVGAIESADGRPTTDAGIGLTAVTAFFMLPVFLLARSNLRARRLPVMRLYREGIEVREIGRTSLDVVPMVPAVFRLAWSLLSGQGFRVQYRRLPWDSLAGIKVLGPPITRIMIIHGPFATISDGFPEPAGNEMSQIGFHQSEFKLPLDQVAESLRGYQWHPGFRVSLTSWPEPSMIHEQGGMSDVVSSSFLDGTRMRTSDPS